MAEQCDRNRLLIVDDDANVRRLFSHIIKTGFPEMAIDTAINLAEAVDAIAAGHHAVIVMDLSMPVMSGLEAFEEVQALCKERDWEMCAVVFCTAFAEPVGLDTLVGEGSRHGLLRKPAKVKELRDAISQRLQVIS